VNDEDRLGRIAAVDTYLNRVVKYVEFRYVGLLTYLNLKVQRRRRWPAEPIPVDLRG
jgi:hypothetical protein